jgi:predicted O-methyltransferase YrrM
MTLPSFQVGQVARRIQPLETAPKSFGVKPTHGTFHHSLNVIRDPGRALPMSEIRNRLSIMPSLDQLKCQLAGHYGVSTDIHEADHHIFNFLPTHPNWATPAVASQEYFRNGRESAERVQTLLSTLMPTTGPSSLLEFAPGYGCVTRHLQRLLPSTRIVPCDIHLGAIDFIKRTIGINGVLSRTVPEEAALGEAFDVTFSLSFFLHMRKATWSHWLRELVEATKPGGVVIFTTHGLKSGAMMSNPPLDADGFWFDPQSEQIDPSPADYGTTITTFDFVYGQIANSPARLVQFHEGLWWGH